jgi:23S rRNA (guanosine2251-2'-O)-methyltransferase
MNELDRLSPGAFASTKKIPVAILLDHIRSALNVGSIFRTSDAFALEKIYLCGITATPPHREILKTALGSTETVSWEYCTNSLEALAKLKAAGYEIWAVEQAEGSIPLQSLDFQGIGKLALVFGNEVDGVGDDVLHACDGCIEIPQFGTKHSLNVAVCAGIVAWEAAKRYNFK